MRRLASLLPSSSLWWLDHHVPSALWTDATYLKKYRTDWRAERIR